MSFAFGLKMNEESQKIRKLLKRKVSSSQSFKELSFSCDRKPLKGIPENSIVVSFRTFTEKRLWMSKL